MEIKTSEIAVLLGGTVVSGNAAMVVSGINELKNAKTTDISFILKAKNTAEAQSSAAKVIISDSVDIIEGKTIIKVKSAKVAYAKTINLFYPALPSLEFTAQKASLGKNLIRGEKVHISDFVFIGDNVQLGTGTYLYPGVFVGANVKIGENTIIYPNVVIYENTEIGNNTIIHAGASIGADGFGFVEDEGKIIKVPQIGKVKIGNSVEIGANCTIDKAAFGTTIISDMVKIDNLVMIAHNVTIGPGTIIVSQTGISGSTKIGAGCVIGGQVGIVDHVELGDKVMIGAQAGVTKDVPNGAVLTGTPARPLTEQRRAEAYMMKLAELFGRVKNLEEKNK
ncbi:MAG: UDP-3-O-(3-hydroxymyristoyl)glucosamine N-acyltransferase [bacterium]